MNKNKALALAGIVFFIVATMHVLRLVYQWDVVVGAIVIPMWVSGVACLVALILSILMFRSRRRQF